MVKAKDAIATARALMGTPYKEMDCIALIRAVIKKSPGGEKNYRCEGTNWLWRSIGNSGKYKHLTWRQDGTGGARAGMLAFKRSGENVHHVGLVTECGTVIHSSSAAGFVVETVLDDTWHLLGIHRYIEAAVVLTEPAVPEDVSPDAKEKKTTLINAETGSVFTLVGSWRFAED